MARRNSHQLNGLMALLKLFCIAMIAMTKGIHNVVTIRNGTWPGPLPRDTEIDKKTLSASIDFKNVDLLWLMRSPLILGWR